MEEFCGSIQVLVSQCDRLVHGLRVSGVQEFELPLTESSYHLHRASTAVSDIAGRPRSDGVMSNALTAADFDQVFGLLGALAERCERAASSVARSPAQGLAFELDEIRRCLQGAMTILHQRLRGPASTDGSGQHRSWEIRNQVGEDAGSMGDRAPGPAADGRPPRGPRQTCPRCGSARWVFYGRLMWAYAIERWDPASGAAESRLQGMLMERGAEEWELVTALTMPDGASLLTFKRPS